MVSDGQPPVKRVKAEMVEVNLDENTLAAEEEVVVKEEVNEMEMEGMEVSKHLRKALEAKVMLIHRSVKSWKEKKMVEERESAYLLKNLLLEQKRKERCQCTTEYSCEWSLFPKETAPDRLRISTSRSLRKDAAE